LYSFFVEKINKAGIFLVVLSTYILALTIPISIAGDSIGVGVGAIGLLLILISKDFKNFPSLKPIILIFTAPILTMLSQFSLSFLSWSCINHHVLPYFTVYKALKERRISNTLIYLLSISSTLMSIVVILEAFTHKSFNNINFLNINFYFSNPMVANGTFSQHLITAAISLILFFAFFGFWQYFSHSINFFIFPLIFLLLSLLFTQSRGAWLGLITGLLLLLYKLNKNKSIFLLIFLTILIVPFFIYQSPIKKRIFSIITPDYRGWSAKDRIILWNDYLITFKQYNLKAKLFGEGKRTRLILEKNFPVAFYKVTGQKKPFNEIKYHFHGGISHNIYLRYLDETGIVGLLFFLFFWIYILWINIANAKNHPLRDILLSFSAGYIAFLVMGFFENNFVDAATNMALMFIIGLNMFLIEHRKPL